LVCVWNGVLLLLERLPEWNALAVRKRFRWELLLSKCCVLDIGESALLVASLRAHSTNLALGGNHIWKRTSHYYMYLVACKCAAALDVSQQRSLLLRSTVCLWSDRCQAPQAHHCRSRRNMWSNSGTCRYELPCCNFRRRLLFDMCCNRDIACRTPVDFHHAHIVSFPVHTSTLTSIRALGILPHIAILACVEPLYLRDISVPSPTSPCSDTCFQPAGLGQPLDPKCFRSNTSNAIFHFRRLPVHFLCSLGKLHSYSAFTAGRVEGMPFYTSRWRWISSLRMQDGTNQCRSGTTLNNLIEYTKNEYLLHAPRTVHGEGAWFYTRLGWLRATPTLQIYGYLHKGRT